MLYAVASVRCIQKRFIKANAYYNHNVKFLLHNQSKSQFCNSVDNVVLMENILVTVLFGMPCLLWNALFASEYLRCILFIYDAATSTNIHTYVHVQY